MDYLHKEGRRILLHLFFVLMALNIIWGVLFPQRPVSAMILIVASVISMLVVAAFFRNPKRFPAPDELKIIAPADGKIVVIEEVDEPEFFGDKRLMVSIFMSVKNIHVNRNPISGLVKYIKYHPGRYWVAWHPKSSEENERTSIVVGNNNIDILVRQIAGKLARRIVYYLSEGDKILQGSEFGFIKFGSRVDIFLPLDTKLNINLHQRVKGGETVIAEIVKPKNI